MDETVKAAAGMATAWRAVSGASVGSPSGAGRRQFGQSIDPGQPSSSALKAAGSKPRATFYPGVGHGSWERAYGEKELPRWLLAQRRRSP